MNKTHRTLNILAGVLMIAIAFVLAFLPVEGFFLIGFVVGAFITLRGLNGIANYFLLTRHMVGGQKSLYLSVILLDFGVFMLLLVDQPRLILLFYLMGILLFTGVVDLLRFFELVRLKNKYWAWRLIRCLCAFATSFLCAFFYKSTELTAYLYAGWWMVTGIERIIDTVKPKPMTYIQ